MQATRDMLHTSIHSIVIDDCEEYIILCVVFQIGGRSAEWTQLDSTPHYSNLILDCHLVGCEKCSVLDYYRHFGETFYVHIQGTSEVLLFDAEVSYELSVYVFRVAKWRQQCTPKSWQPPTEIHGDRTQKSIV
jgi:hypothetical protein